LSGLPAIVDKGFHFAGVIAADERIADFQRAICTITVESAAPVRPALRSRCRAVAFGDAFNSHYFRLQRIISRR